MTGETRQRILELARAGQSCRSIAVEVGLAPSTVSGVAKAAGVVFARLEQTEAATRTRVAEVKTRRSVLQLDLLDDLDVARRQLRTAPDTKGLAEAARAIRDLAMAHGRIVSLDAPVDDDLDRARADLRSIWGGLRAQYIERHGEAPEDRESA